MSDEPTHQCPRKGCTRVVPDRQFCCFPDWRLLSESARQGIQATATYKLLSPERRTAIQIAINEWGTL